MIGPHEGIELELMLAGKKHLAVFCDARIPGQDIPEDIIPEKQFAPYVGAFFVRTEKDICSAKSDTTLHYVCFTTKQETWRAETFFWIIKEIIESGKPTDLVWETMIGRLLEYEEKDILDYLKNSKILNRTKDKDHL